MKLISINPTTGEKLEEFSEFSKQQITEILEKSQQAFHRWKNTKYSERKILLKKTAQTLRDNSNDYAKLITMEMGKPINQAVAEVEKCAWVCDYYAYHGEKYLADEKIETDAAHSMIRYAPVGTILAIMPWNFPFWQVFRCAAPSLMAGNTMVLKHSSNVPQCSLAIEEIFATAGFPFDVFQSMLIGAKATHALIADKRIAAISLTGSTNAGSYVAAQAGKHLKKVVLELGGSDPFIVLNDADLDFIIPKAIFARIQNNGQSCIAAKRFIISADNYDKFCTKLTNQVKQLNIGDPMQSFTDIGPLIQKEAVQQLDNQVKQSLEKGAKLLCGGTPPQDIPGFFYPPTVVSDVTKGMRVYDQETFGPVFALIKAETEQDIVALANDTPFGLGASIWSASKKYAQEIGNQILAGNIFINEIVKSDPRLPFGGIKESGYGRELSMQGIREFVNIQTVYINEHKK
ncbi:MAG: NAD-dependent succinate-semialdehyde dehydrogenase [Candidatus Thermoplasmatota archaeon]|nr:NAD-dependent succinate-semialdehyde dehydrogenase [Candidatus Thermoplasmatota archaeon]MBU1941638.1 NAD-dependent succinate-semialdehyde dehydrogenase [Candidatus Thermoplasmatota archaeon]